MDTNALFKIGYGLYVLTAMDQDKHNGCIINTLQQLTSDPLRISITVNKANFTHDMILRSGEFNVSILSEQATFDLFKHFGFQSGRTAEKIAGQWDLMGWADNGLSYVKTAAANAYLSAKVFQTVDLGTHTMFIADLTDAKSLSDTPSATYSYYHAHIKPKPEKKASGGWRCKICGYVHEGNELPADFVCPLCKHGAVDFEKI
jgi:flavin reductase (DIM6/NTAB) family NADH-FMN oxidoreductase RutF